MAISAVTAGLRHSDLAGGQQDARMLFENLSRTNAFLDTVAQTHLHLKFTTAGVATYRDGPGLLLVS